MLKFAIFCILFFQPILSHCNGNIKFNAAIFNEGTMIPFYSGFMSIPVHPGILLGGEYYYQYKEKIQLFQSVNLALYFHKKFEHGIFLNSEFGICIVFSIGIAPEVLMGIGYLNTFNNDPIFEQNSSGEYELTKDHGRPHLMGLL